MSAQNKFILKRDSSLNPVKAIAFIILSMTFIGGTIWTLLCPINFDDWIYLYTFPEGDPYDFFFCGGREISSFSDALATARMHYMHVNGRLATILHILFVPAGKTIEGIFIGCMIVLTALLLVKTANEDKKISLWSAIFAVLLMWTCLPWYDGMQSIDFKQNYVTVSVLLLVIMLLVDNREYLLSSKKIWLLYFLGFIIGWMHESFAVGIGSYVFLKIFFEKSPKVRIKLGIELICIIIGFAVNYFGATAERASYVKLFPDYKINWFYQAREMFVAIIAIILFGVELFFSPDRKGLLKKRLPLIFAIGVSYYMVLCLNCLGRVGWCLFLLSIVLLLQCIQHLINKAGRKFSITCGCIFIVLYGIWLTELCIWEYKLNKETDEIYEYIDNRYQPGQPFSGVLYMDNVIDDREIPYYLMGIVSQPLMERDANRHFASHFTHKNDALMPVDSKLEGKPFAEWPEVEGTAGFRGTWPYVATKKENLAPQYNLTFGKHHPGTSPIIKIYDRADEKTECLEIELQYELKEVILPQGDTIYWAHFSNLKKTIRSRDILRIDTVK